MGHDTTRGASRLCDTGCPVPTMGGEGYLGQMFHLLSSQDAAEGAKQKTSNSPFARIRGARSKNIIVIVPARVHSAAVRRI